VLRATHWLDDRLAKLGLPVELMVLLCFSMCEKATRESIDPWPLAQSTLDIAKAEVIRA
jgi:hypothetical protein